MKSLLIVSIAFVVFFLAGCGSPVKKPEPVLLINADRIQDFYLEVTGDAEAQFVSAGSHENALKFTCGGKDQSPCVIIHDSAKLWKLSKCHYLMADIANPGKDSVLVEIRLNANGWLNQGIVIPSGKTRSIRIDIPQDSIPEYYQKKIIGMYNLPDGIIRSDQKTDLIHKISFLVICPAGETTLFISNIRGEGNFHYPPQKDLAGDYFPLVDDFGQYRHADWVMKTHSLEELKKSVETELADINHHPKPTGWDKYGGWLNGPRLKATGNFRTEKVKGKWWLVDPDGYLFWSHGMGSVAIGDGTAVITDREFYFTGLPDSVKYKDFYSRGWRAPFGYYKDRETRSFDEIAWNLFRKYGDGWKEKVTNMVPIRLMSWGQNTLGAWTTSDIYLKSTLPYTPIIMINSRKIEGSKGHWYKYADPYDSSLIGNLTRKIRSIEKSTTDPYCIGYYVDNEITWGDTTSIANWTIASPEDQPAKIVLLALLRKKYESISELNRKWNMEFTSWDGFMKNTRLFDIRNEDTREFTLMAINEYFTRVRSTLKKLAPHKLYLGPRLDFHFYPSDRDLNDWDFRNDWIVNLAAKYCDVVSFNRYRHSAADLRPGNADKPVIIGEWHHLPLEKGSFYIDQSHFSGSLQMRASKYNYYIQSCLSNPYIVGAHYFQFFDQPTVGRADGENFSCGFLNICDRPYGEMVNISRKIGNELYQVRYSK
jgi:hypothetical protein